MECENNYRSNSRERESDTYARDLVSHLPEDIILHIATYSGIADVLALKQTCRNLHAMIDSDYLWHQLLPREELPLEIPPSIDLRTFGFCDLQRSVVRALRLRANWSREEPLIHGLYIVNANHYDGTFDELKFINGATTLLAIRRDRHSQRPTTIVCAYTLLDVSQIRPAARFSISATMRDFDACVVDAETILTLATIVARNDAEALEVYSAQMSLSNSTICNGTYETPYRFSLRREGLFHKVSLHSEYVASSISHQILDEGGRSPRVLVANWRTKEQFSIFPQIKDNGDLIDIRILPPYLAIITASVSSIQIILVPLNIISLGGVFEPPATSKAKQDALPEFSIIDVPFMDFYDICISDNVNFGAHVPATSLSLIAFPTLSRLEMRQSKKALHLRFSINTSRSLFTQLDRGVLNGETPVISLDRSTPFDIPVGSYPEHAHLGTTGRRAVWLEQSLKSDYVKILRLDYDPSKGGPPSVNILLPSEPQLPFKPSSCRALAFDEATGRLCVCLYNGALYMIDYA